MIRFLAYQSHGVAGVTLAQLAALVLPFLFVARNDLGAHAFHLAAALIAALAWEALFDILRKRGPGVHGVTTALIVAILIPHDIAAWQVMLAVSLGVILGELVFGGRGFGFVSPATLSLSFLVISFPQVHLAVPSIELALATLPGAVVLLALGLISWRILLATTLAVAALLAFTGQGLDAATLGAALAFGLVFLVSDPVSAAATNAGRWIFGALAGGLIVVFSSGEALSTEAVVFAALMANVFAPLIDRLVVLSHIRLRKVRHA